MGSRFKALIKNHFLENPVLYILTLLLFLLGVAAGSFGVLILSPEQQKELAAFIDQYLTGLENVDDLDPSLLAQDAVFENIKIIGLIWFLGLTVIGIPLILALVFLQGFVLGFTAGFLIAQKEALGLLLALFSILPQNILNIPALVIGSVSALSFSIWLIKGRFRGQQVSFGHKFLVYCSIMFLVALAVCAGGLVEAYFSPVFMKLIVTYFP